MLYAISPKVRARRLVSEPNKELPQLIIVKATVSSTRAGMLRGAWTNDMADTNDTIINAVPTPLALYRRTMSIRASTAATMPPAKAELKYGSQSPRKTAMRISAELQA